MDLTLYYGQIFQYIHALVYKLLYTNCIIIIVENVFIVADCSSLQIMQNSLMDVRIDEWLEQRGENPRYILFYILFDPEFHI